MKIDFIIAVAQTHPIKGDIDANLRDHTDFIKMASQHKANIIVFPELSLTGYEPELAAQLAITVDDTQLEPLDRLATKLDITIIAGAPIRNPGGKPFIGAVIFGSDGRKVYLKQHLHPGEEKFFIAGDRSGVLQVKGVAVGLAICADIGLEVHAREAAADGASIYAACVFITPGGYANDAALLQGYASRHGIAVIISNYCGVSGGLAAAGKSTVWDERGCLIVQADEHGRQLTIAERTSGKWRGKIIPL